MKSRKHKYCNKWNVVLFVNLCWFQRCSAALKGEKRLDIFKNRVTRKISGPKSKEVTEDYSKLLNEEFHDFHTSPLFISDEVTGNEMGGAFGTLGSRGKIYRLLV